MTDALYKVFQYKSRSDLQQISGAGAFRYEQEWYILSVLFSVILMHGDNSTLIIPEAYSVARFKRMIFSIHKEVDVFRIPWGQDKITDFLKATYSAVRSLKDEYVFG